MEKAMTKVGSFWISKKAKKEFSNIADDLSSISGAVEEKAKRVIDKLKGNPPKALPDLLREHNLPPGLFPRNITCYELDASRSKLVVHLPSACEASFKDGSAVRYAKRVKGTLSRGKLEGIEGMKTKVLVWVKVTGVAVESHKSNKIWVTAGVKKPRPRDAYETARDAIPVDEF
ncbi:uncharacterized protein J3R85_003355 [Psidium guajava]|nr:uncharacterized protein J3R85_003355 [Psidium guajava]